MYFNLLLLMSDSQNRLLISNLYSQSIVDRARIMEHLPENTAVKEEPSAGSVLTKNSLNSDICILYIE